MAAQRILVFPFWTDNPYLNQLYLAPLTQGVTLTRVSVFEGFLAELAALGGDDLIHLHWTGPIVQRGETEDEGRSRRFAFQAAVDAAIERGARLIWTVHNTFPHEMRYREEELELIEFLNDRAATIHVLSPSTAAVVRQEYTLDEAKIVSVPHSSYWGVYDQTVERARARSELGLTDDDISLVFVGQMRPYKGIDELLATIGLLTQRDERYILIMAGKTSDDDARAIAELVPAHARVRREHRFIPDEEVPRWLRAGDVAVLPYRNVLNSGSIFLAATFGLPVVVPDQPSLRSDFATEPWVCFATGDDRPLALADAVEEAVGRSAAASESAVRWARSYTPWEMSRRFADDVLARFRASDVTTP